MITRHQMQGIIDALVRMRAGATDEQALDAIALYPAWKPDTAYSVYGRIRFGDKLFRCVQAHTSQTGWEPDATPALWTEVAAPGEIPVWRQPTGAQDAYMTGDKVWYPEKDTTVYVSLIDNNVWSPADYPQGWQKI